jgi:hypothetical protein
MNVRKTGERNRSPVLELLSDRFGKANRILRQNSPSDPVRSHPTPRGLARPRQAPPPGFQWGLSESVYEKRIKLTHQCKLSDADRETLTGMDKRT